MRIYVIKKSFFKFFSAIFDFWVYHFFVKKSRISHFAIRIRIFANSHFAIRTKMRKCENANAKKCDEFASHSHSKFAKPSLSLRIRIRILRSRRIRIAFAIEDECEFISLISTRTNIWWSKILKFGQFSGPHLRQQQWVPTPILLRPSSDPQLSF